MRWKRVRPYVVGVVILGALVGAFFGIVAPLFARGVAPQAEVTGLFDTQLKAGRPQQLAVAVDNTGDHIIAPLCIRAEFSAPVMLGRALFDNTDPHTFDSAGRACGGELVGQETINIIIEATPQTAGSVVVRVTPYQGATAIGAPLTMRVTVT